MRPRNHALEAELTDIAARAAGRFGPNGEGDDRGLSAFANHRALPGGIREDLDGVKEAGEEYADARNYLVWEIEKNYAAFLAGDDEAGHKYDRCMRSLTKLVEAWHELHTRSA